MTVNGPQTEAETETRPIHRLPVLADGPYLDHDLIGAPPVFVHSSFRTGSTWLWQKMREAPTVLAYYEIFNDILATLSAKQVKELSPSAWNSEHPPAIAYFLEFLPLLSPEGGIAGFDAGMSFGEMIPQAESNDSLPPEQESYVGRLIAHAQERKKIPVLTCTRTLGRARALRRFAGGSAIVLHRNLFHQWASYCRHADAGNHFYMEAVLKTVWSAPEDPFLKMIGDWFDLNNPSVPREILFQVFVILHLYLYSIAFDAADVVIDLTMIAIDNALRRRAEDEVSGLIQYRLDFSDARNVCQYPGMAISDLRPVREAVDQFVKLMPVASVSARGMALIERAKREAFEQFEAFEFASRPTRIAFAGKIASLEARLAEQTAACEALRTESGRLTQELSAISGALAGERAAKAAQEEALCSVTKERDRLNQQLSLLYPTHDAFCEHTNGSDLNGIECDAVVEMPAEVKAAEAE